MPKYKFVGNDRIESKHWAVELVDLGEGLHGDYNPDDPNDIPLLRFDYYSRQDTKSDWEVPNDSSYCTQLNAELSKADKRIALRILLDQVIYEDWDFNVKKLGEWMSWINEEDIKLRKLMDKADKKKKTRKK